VKRHVLDMRKHELFAPMSNDGKKGGSRKERPYLMRKIVSHFPCILQQGKDQILNHKSAGRRCIFFNLYFPLSTKDILNLSTQTREN